MEIGRICGLVLAGGKGVRMGGCAKGTLQLGGRDLVSRVVERFKPQVSQIVIVSNEKQPTYVGTGLPVIADEVEGAGPLAGLSAGMNYLKKAVPRCQRVAVVTVDCPFLPVDLVKRLDHKLDASAADVAYAGSLERQHPLFSLWPIEMAAVLDAAVRSGEARKVFGWLNRYNAENISWPASPIDPFFNINCPQDLKTAECFLKVQENAASA